MKTNATLEELEKAMALVNKRYAGNICFNRGPEKQGKNFLFTLKVKDSNGPGHSIGYAHFLTGHNPRRLTSACWHVHGYFFEALFKVNPKAIVWSRKNKITSDYGNWEDWNAGSQMYPQYMSEKCECNA